MKPELTAALDDADIRTVEGSQRFLARGPILEYLDRAEEAETLSAALCRFGLPHYDAILAGERILSGDAFLAVRCPDTDLAVEVTEIMEIAEADTIGASIAVE